MCRHGQCGNLVCRCSRSKRGNLFLVLLNPLRIVFFSFQFKNVASVCHELLLINDVILKFDQQLGLSQSLWICGTGPSDWQVSDQGESRNLVRQSKSGDVIFSDVLRSDLEQDKHLYFHRQMFQSAALTLQVHCHKSFPVFSFSPLFYPRKREASSQAASTSKYRAFKHQTVRWP